MNKKRLRRTIVVLVILAVVIGIVIGLFARRYKFPDVNEIQSVQIWTDSKQADELLTVSDEDMISYICARCSKLYKIRRPDPAEMILSNPKGIRIDFTCGDQVISVAIDPRYNNCYVLVSEGGESYLCCFVPTDIFDGFYNTIYTYSE